MKICLVTGAAGFIGSHVCRKLLSEGHVVYGVDNFTSGQSAHIQVLSRHPNFRFHRVDVRLLHSFDIYFDRSCGHGSLHEIWHLACPASPKFYQSDAIATLSTCFEGTLNMLRLAVKHDARILVSSTSEVRGNVSCTGPRACYDEGKRVAETLCCEFRRVHRADVRLVRIFNTYGPGMRLDDGRVVTNFIRNALARKALTVHGDGTQTRSFCYITDLVEACFLIMRSDHPDFRNAEDVLNVGNPDDEVSVIELAERIVRLSRNDVKSVRFLDRPPDDPARRRPDTTAIRERLGWAPRVPLDEGLRKTFASYAE